MLKESDEKIKSGYILLWRSFVNWEWFTDIKTCHLFQYCLLRANYTETSWRGIAIKRGQFITSLKTISIETGLTIQQVRTALKHLKMTGELTCNTTSSYSIITVKNYDVFQNTNIRYNRQETNEQQTNNKQATTDNTLNTFNTDNTLNTFNISDEKPKQKLDPFINPVKDFFTKTYKEVFKVNRVDLSNAHCLKIVELNECVENFIETIPETLNKLKNVDFDLPNFTANYTWLLKDDNYITVLAGTYDKKLSKQDQIAEDLKRELGYIE